MRIVCPQCAASYGVPDHLLVGRKTVRCAQCGQSWAPEQPPFDAAPPIMPVPPPAAPVPMPAGLQTPAVLFEQIAPPRADPPPGRALTLLPSLPWQHWLLPGAWLASLFVAVAGFAVLVGAHSAIAAAWPPALRLYTLLGLA